MKLLYVEDNPIDADLTRRYLQKHAPQMSVETTATFSEAVSRLPPAQSPRYDVVLTDLRLPDGAGIELVKYIRQRSLPLAAVVITGAGDELTAISSLKAGADDYIVKRDDYLVRLPLTLETAVHRYRAVAARRARYLKVFYAEHSREDVELTRRHLAQFAPHIQVDAVLTGIEALERLAKSASLGYHVILLDYRLPGAHALELLKELRENRELDVPVVLVTGHGDEEVALQAIRLGATSYLIKEPGYLYKLPGELENAYFRAELLREQAALRENEERLRLAVELGRMGVWDWHRRTNALKWSKETFKIIGLEPDNLEVTYQMWAECVHRGDLARVEEAMESAIAERKEYHSELRMVRRDGAVRWVESRGQPVYDERGECVRLMGVSVDITERKRAEEELRAALEEVKRLKERAEAENIYLREEVSGVHRFGEIVGESRCIDAVLRQVSQVAETDTTALITGETGTGKELVARAIHGSSARKQRPLVKVNCSALPAELMETELFGHEKGAFTNALNRRIGRFELADGGTIFLDEIGDLALSLQSKLLRVLQEGEFERLGSSKTIHVNARVIAATNRDLSEAMRKEAFRSDLYYRLAVFPIHLPPLRERKEDISLLAEVFLKETSRRLGRPFDRMPSRVIEAFTRYDWPGNVRELQNVIERAAVTSAGSTLTLPEQWESNSMATCESPAMPARDHPAISAPRHVFTPDGMTLAEFEKAQILRVLDEVGWKVEGAAAILGLRPSTLRSRMQRLGISKN